MICKHVSKPDATLLLHIGHGCSNGGLGDSIAQVLARFNPAPVEMVAVDDQFGQSGEPLELLKHYKMDAPAIAEAIKKAKSRKAS